jgi:mRNA (guanine-N7-)-methyltransferase
MRNLNNWVKSQLIERAFDLTSSSSSRGRKGISVLDFCCGKGGDVFKWLKSPKGSKTGHNGGACC